MDGLAGQGESAGAEELLLAGYEGLRAAHGTPRDRLRAAIERLVSFYEASGRNKEAAVWRNRLKGFAGDKS